MHPSSGRGGYQGLTPVGHLRRDHRRTDRTAPSHGRRCFPAHHRAARTGGVLYPITKELAAEYESEPGPTADRIGSFLMVSTFHAHDVTCAMFMTSIAANPMIAELAMKSANISLSWGDWILGSIVPGLLSLAVLPYMLFKIMKPEVTETPEAPKI
jgi:divalent anion:Na+ symporter, DASS family